MGCMCQKRSKYAEVAEMILNVRVKLGSVQVEMLWGIMSTNGAYGEKKRKLTMHNGMIE